jgi:hypothetical protein
MPSSKRATVYFDPEIHRALRLKAATTERSVSDLVNEAVELALGEDAADLEAFEQRRGEPVVSFDEVVKDLRRRGRI